MAVSRFDPRSEIEEVGKARRPALVAPKDPPANVYKDLAEAFKMFDLNGDGKISQVELGTILASLGESLSETELEQMIKDVDADGDGNIDLKEFISLNWDAEMRAYASSDMSNAGGEDASSTEALQSAFDVFDSDKDGFISTGELHRVLSGLGDDQISMEDCRYMIRCVDADGDELVDFKEFQTLMTGPLAGQSAQRVLADHHS